MGTLKPNILNQEFTTNNSVENGLNFLLRVNEKNNHYVGNNVIVIGGGYTAMDCARTALRLGAKSVKTFYRRDQKDLDILPGELEELVNEKGKMIFKARPNTLINKNNTLEFLELIKTKSGKNDKQIVDIFNSKFKIKADHIILAIGQKQEFKTTKSITNIFHAGDYKLGATTLINAIGDAKNTAKQVDNFLMKRDLTNFEYKVKHGVQTSRSLKFNYIPVTDMRLRDLPKRTFKNEVEIGYNKTESKKESSRCYLCHYQYEINDDLCVLCDECLLVRPVNECIKEVSSKSISEDGRVSIKRIEPGKSHGIYHGLLYIDPKVCVRCGECEKACPTGAIKLTKVTKVNASA